MSSFFGNASRQLWSNEGFRFIPCGEETQPSRKRMRQIVLLQDMLRWLAMTRLAVFAVAGFSAPGILAAC
jgi:hypothetical protein